MITALTWYFSVSCFFQVIAAAIAVNKSSGADFFGALVAIAVDVAFLISLYPLSTCH